jgi:hypothetical protein
MQGSRITGIFKATLFALAGVLVVGLLLGSSVKVHAQTQPPVHQALV